MATNREQQVGQGGRGSSSTTGRSSRGFAAMDAQKQREIARKGGEASARSQVRDEQGQFGGRRQAGGRADRGSGGGTHGAGGGGAAGR